MISLEYIRQLQDEAAELAAAEGLTPYAPWNTDEIETYPPFPFPNLGNYRPNGWTCAVWLFVDKTGWGYESEPALTVDELISLLKQYQELGLSLGYAIVEEGQFQLHLGVFVPDRHIDEVRDFYENVPFLDSDDDSPLYALFSGKGVFPQI